MNTFLHVSKQDMELLPPAFQFTAADEIPVTFSYGDRTMRVKLPTALSSELLLYRSI